MEERRSTETEPARRSGLLFAAAVGAAAPFPIISWAGELPKHGTFGVANTTSGKLNRVFVGGGAAIFGLWDETWTVSGHGFLKGAAWRCYWTVECMQGTCETPYGYCFGAEPDGDQIVFRLSVDRYLLGAKIIGATARSVIGTGKFQGVTASFDLPCRPNMARPGEYTDDCDGKGSYKLP